MDRIWVLIKMNRGGDFMKRFFIVLSLILGVFGCTNVFAGTENSILIKTADNTEAIKTFKKAIYGHYGRLLAIGFDKDCYIGTPFCDVIQNENCEDSYSRCYYPIIKNGEILTYICQYDNGYYWTIYDWFVDDVDLRTLNDGNAYTLISRGHGDFWAVSDQRVIKGRNNEDGVTYWEPYKNVDTKIVDITVPLDIDLTFFDNLSSEELDFLKKYKFASIIRTDDVDVMNVNDRILVPLRYITENLGYDIDWNGSDKTVTIDDFFITLKFTIGSNEYTVRDINGETIRSSDVSPQIYDGKTYLPIRVIGEAFGTEVLYSAHDRAVLIGELPC